uniref:Uncharacterized protein n=1 Tax=Photinus pyralis TaxID=7054 RepID=A0A1Y1NJE3_PHOPY
MATFKTQRGWCHHKVISGIRRCIKSSTYTVRNKKKHVKKLRVLTNHAGVWGGMVAKCGTNLDGKSVVSEKRDGAGGHCVRQRSNGTASSTLKGLGVSTSSLYTNRINSNR